jgi:hypothetical protein
MSEDDLLQIVIDIDSETFEYWSYVEISFLSPSGLSQYLDVLSFDRLTSEIWSKIALHLRGVCSDDQRLRRFSWCETLFGQSSIVATCPPPLQQFKSAKWRLLYRGTRDGFRSSDFHQKCDGCANTVTLILSTTGAIFGGFTSVPWDSTSGARPDLTPKSFLFTVKTEEMVFPRVFPIKNKERAINCSINYGPVFGCFRADLSISDNCDMDTSSSTMVGNAYEIGAGVSSYALAGDNHFQVKEIEVFSVIQ